MKKWLCFFKTLPPLTVSRKIYRSCLHQYEALQAKTWARDRAKQEEIWKTEKETMQSRKIFKNQKILT
ncbi:hypothetical protein A4A49_25813 [Nicotiana attenuata]|uniref:Uncharacterized protein n=1 Tax=Nicotiana attenuata TaxID=49451 RepID=A0A314L3C8_NICAT|nr:hypothetical protein A4A49_25813 [Nicotiana attenuata]